MSKEFSRLDAGEQIFFNQELTKTKARSYDVQYPELKARSLIPVSYDAGPGAEAIRYEQYDSVGFAKIVSSYASDFPRCDIKGKEFSSIVKSLGDSYGYNVQEIRAAMMAGKPLQQRRANAARRAILAKEHDLAMWGDAVHNLGGFLTNTNIPSGTVPADGVGPSTLWSTKTPEQWLRDMSLCAAGPTTNTNGVEQANVLLLPLEHYSMVASTPFTNVTDMTVLQFFLKNNPFIKSVEWALELSAANQVGKLDNPVNFMMAYNRSPDKLTLEIPSDFEQFAPQEVGLDYVVHCHERFGGVIWYYPLSAQIYDGI